jgi:hypothetical protein
MPTYFMLLPAFVLASAAAAVGTLVVWFSRRLRPMFPFVWRAWLWGTLGFFAANALFFVALLVIVPVVETLSSTSWLHNPVRFVEGVIVVLGPLGASALGGGFGVFLGCFLGWRVVDARARAALAATPSSTSR